MPDADVRLETQRDDWMLETLAKNPDCVLSGHSSLRERLELPDGVRVEVRVAGDRRRVRVCLVTVAAPRGAWRAVAEACRRSERMAELLAALQRLGLPANWMLIYDPKSDVEFGLSPDGATFELLSSAELAGKFGTVDPRLVRDVGTTKLVNKSVNDSFQAWTRENLSKYLCITDVDALVLAEEVIVLELKRVQEDVTDWFPYVDDESNYALQRTMTGPEVRVVNCAYDPKNPDQALLFTVTESEGRYAPGGGRLQGERSVVDPQTLAETTGLQVELDDTYESQRHRQND